MSYSFYIYGLMVGHIPISMEIILKLSGKGVCQLEATDASEPKLLQNGVLSSCFLLQAHYCFVLYLLFSWEN